MAGSDASADDVVAALRRVQFWCRARQGPARGWRPTTRRSECGWATCSPRPRHTPISPSTRSIDCSIIPPTNRGRRRCASWTSRPGVGSMTSGAARCSTCTSAAMIGSRRGTWSTASAPRVVGGHLSGRSVAPLLELAVAPEPLRRRTAVTAPLYFVRAGTNADVDGGFEVAGLLAGDMSRSCPMPSGSSSKTRGDP